MNQNEKITTSALIITLGLSVMLYGVWKDKVTLYAPLLIIIYLALAGWVIGRFKNHTVSEIKTPPGGTPLLLFWFYSAFMIPFSVLPYEAKIGVLRFGCYLGTYWVTANLLPRFSHRKVVLTSMLVFLVFVALYSLVQHKINFEMLYGQERYVNYKERLGGVYICPNHIAHLFQMWLPFCFVFLLIPQIGLFWRISFGYALLLFSLLIYQTQSRAGLLGVLAALGLTSFLLLFSKSRRAFHIACIAIPLLMIGALAGLWFGSSMFRDRMQPVAKVITCCISGDLERAVSMDFRSQTWMDSLQMIKDRPFLGVGTGNYGQIFPEYRQRWKGLRYETVHPHNEYIELLTEHGIVGGILILCAFVSVFIQSVRWIKTTEHPSHAFLAIAFLGALGGTAVHGFFDFELRIFPNALMLALLAGIAIAPLLQLRDSTLCASATSSKNIVTDFKEHFFAYVFAVAMILSAAWSLQVMSSAWIRVLGDRARSQPACTLASKFYRASVAIDPQNWLAYYGEGRILRYYRYYELDPEIKHDLNEKERTTFQKAHQINSKKEEIIYGLARSELAFGNRDVGLNYLRQAANYKRFNDFYWRKLGIELRKASLYEEARDAFLYAKKLDRSNQTVQRNLQWLKEREKNE